MRKVIQEAIHETILSGRYEIKEIEKLITHLNKISLVGFFTDEATINITAYICETGDRQACLLEFLLHFYTVLTLKLENTIEKIDKYVDANIEYISSFDKPFPYEVMKQYIPSKRTDGINLYIKLTYLLTLHTTDVVDAITLAPSGNLE